MRARNFTVLAFVLAQIIVEAAEKKLIEFGWDEPGTKFMREHIAEMQQTPFDGCVFHVEYKDEKAPRRVLRGRVGANGSLPKRT